MTIEIELMQGCKALVSDRHADKIAGKKIYIHKSHGIVYARVFAGHDKFILLHRLITGAKIGEQVDHKDGNGLNCTDENIRICTHSENQRNKRASKNNKSGYKGVSSNGNQWTFRITAKKTFVCVGKFSTPEAAARAYDAKARELFGEFARLNFPDEA